MWKIICCILLVLVILGSVIFFTATPAGRKAVNRWKHSLQKADDETQYETRKKVEDTCRAMIASYNKDKLTYEQYNGNENSEKQEWADQAKMRANSTASTYNEYIRKNSYVWEGNVPEDIDQELPYVE